MFTGLIKNDSTSRFNRVLVFNGNALENLLIPKAKEIGENTILMQIRANNTVAASWLETDGNVQSMSHEQSEISDILPLLPQPGHESRHPDLIQKIVSKYGCIVSVQLNIALIGKEKVGKTSIVQRYVHNKFSSRYKFTIGADFSEKIIQDEYKLKYKLCIWDVGGRDEFSPLGLAFYRGVNVFFLVFDSFDEQNLYSKLNDIKLMTANEFPQIILVKTKSELADDESLSKERLFSRRLISERGAIPPVISVSAKNDTNINMLFSQALQLAIAVDPVLQKAQLGAQINERINSVIESYRNRNAWGHRAFNLKGVNEIINEQDFSSKIRYLYTYLSNSYSAMTIMSFDTMLIHSLMHVNEISNKVASFIGGSTLIIDESKVGVFYNYAIRNNNRAYRTAFLAGLQNWISELQPRPINAPKT